VKNKPKRRIIKYEAKNEIRKRRSEKSEKAKKPKSRKAKNGKAKKRKSGEAKMKGRKLSSAEGITLEKV
jgi:hypothetical protein